jgi:repressor LexA
MEFKDILRQQRIAHNLTQQELGALVGLKKEAIYKYEKGIVVNPKRSLIEKLARIFGISPSYLLGINDSEPSYSTRIPVLGKVVAGIPIEATEEILGYEEITEHMAKTGEHFALRVNGDSMYPNICDGDTVIVKKQNCVESGDTAIVLINGNEATCKKIKITDNGITLIGYNLSVYEPHFYTNEEIASLPVSVIGKVVELRRKF